MVAKYDRIQPSQVNYDWQFLETGRVQRHSNNSTLLLAATICHNSLAKFVYSKGGCTGDKLDPVQAQGMNLRLLSALAEQTRSRRLCRPWPCFWYTRCSFDGADLGHAYRTANSSRRARVIEWTIDKRMHQICM